MKRLAIRQKSIEIGSPSLFAMRAYIMAQPAMPDRELRAFIEWIVAHGYATLAMRKETELAAIEARKGETK